MPCTITDYLSYYSSSLTAQGLQNQQVIAVPGSNGYRIKVSSAFRLLAQNPAVASMALKLGLVATTDSTGLWSLTLPYGDSTETHPATPSPQWSIVLPDGRVFTGVVPSVAGPLALDDLIGSNGWVLNTQVYVAAVTPGTLARGIATITGTDSATVNFASNFASSAYILKLTASLDSVTGAAVVPNYTNKSASGFTISMGGTYTGTVDWEASL